MIPLEEGEKFEIVQYGEQGGRRREFEGNPKPPWERNGQ
jgi:hypothetical protein